MSNVANCPGCGTDSTVKDSRPTELFIRRRRQCLNPKCGLRWTTFEVPAAMIDDQQQREIDARKLHRIADELIGIATEHTEEGL